MTEALALRAMACAAKARRELLTDGDVRSLLRDVLVHAQHDLDWASAVLAFEATARADQAKAGVVLRDWLRSRSLRLRMEGERLETTLERLATPAAEPEDDIPAIVIEDAIDG